MCRQMPCKNITPCGSSCCEQGKFPPPMGYSSKKLWQTFFSFWDLPASLKSQMNKNIPNSRLFFQGAQILGSPDLGPRIYTQFQVERIHFPWATHTVNPLLSPPSPPPPQISSPSNKPPLSFKPLFPSPSLPSSYYSLLIYDILYLSITTVTLRVDWSTIVFFTSWTFRFVFDPRLHDIQKLYLSFYTSQL